MVKCQALGLVKKSNNLCTEGSKGVRKLACAAEASLPYSEKAFSTGPKDENSRVFLNSLAHEVQNG